MNNTTVRRSTDKGLSRLKRAMDSNQNLLSPSEIDFVRTSCRILDIDSEEMVNRIGKRSLEKGNGQVRKVMAAICAQLEVDLEEDGEEGEVLTEAMTSEEELEDEIKRTQAAVNECYRRRGKQAGISIKGTENRLLTEEELDSLSEQLGDGVGARAKRRKEVEKMSIKEMEVEIEGVKETLA
jgi:hypothetical protein